MGYLHSLLTSITQGIWFDLSSNSSVHQGEIQEVPTTDQALETWGTTHWMMWRWKHRMEPQYLKTRRTHNILRYQIPHNFLRMLLRLICRILRWRIRNLEVTWTVKKNRMMNKSQIKKIATILERLTLIPLWIMRIFLMEATVVKPTHSSRIC